MEDLSNSQLKKAVSKRGSIQSYNFQEGVDIFSKYLLKWAKISSRDIQPKRSLIRNFLRKMPPFHTSNLHSTQIVSHFLQRMCPSHAEICLYGNSSYRII